MLKYNALFQNPYLIVVWTICWFLHTGVLLLVADLHTDDRVHVEAGELPRLNDGDRHLEVLGLQWWWLILSLRFRSVIWANELPRKINDQIIWYGMVVKSQFTNEWFTQCLQNCILVIAWLLLDSEFIIYKWIYHLESKVETYSVFTMSHSLVNGLIG